MLVIPRKITALGPWTCQIPTDPKSWFLGTSGLLIVRPNTNKRSVKGLDNDDLSRQTFLFICSVRMI